MFPFLVSLCAFLSVVSSYVIRDGTSCYVYPGSLEKSGHQEDDDTSSILQAFQDCGQYGKVILTDNTFHINKVMNTTDLLNCDVSLYGEMIWSSDVPYWRANSFSVGFQNQSTAWLFGGTNVTFQGHGRGRFNGRGQIWYDENMNTANQPGRPIAITFTSSMNLSVNGLTWSQPQFWHSLISFSENVTMTNISMSAKSNNGNSTINTDGTNTWNSKNIFLENWTVETSDDCIAVKGNTTNLTVKNVTCHGSGGMPIGSIGQYRNSPDFVENILFEDVTLQDSETAAWIKTWPGVVAKTSTNGDAGGGGTGYVRNVTFRNFQCNNVVQPIYVTQCTYNLNASICDTSKLHLSDITWENFTGTSRYNVASSIHCSSSAPCDDLKFVDVNLNSVNASQGLPDYNSSANGEKYQCANIANQNTTSNIPCNGWAPGDFPQHIMRNY